MLGALLVVALIVWIVDQQMVKGIREQVRAELDSELLLAESRIDTFVDSNVRHLNFLYKTPPIQGLARATKNNGVDPFDGTTLSLWEQRLATIFQSLLRTYPNISQARLLRGQDGMEMLRVDRQNGRVERVDELRLQNKGQHAYFQSAITLPEGVVYVSPLELNKENGKIEFPYRLTLRFARAIYDEQNQLFGVLIINVDPQELLFELAEQKPNKPGIIVLDENEQPVYSAMEWLRYWQDVKPNQPLSSVVNMESLGERGFFSISMPQRSVNWVALHRFSRLPGLDSSRGIHLYAFISQSAIDERTVRERWNFAMVLAAVSIVFIAIIAVLGKSLRNARRLNNIRAEFAGIIDGATQGIISLSSSGEIFSLNRAAMQFFEGLDSQAIGKPFHQFRSLPQEYLKKALISLRSQRMAEPLVTTHRNEFGQVLDVQFKVSPVKNQKNKLSGIALVVEDITARKEAERRLEETNQNLEAEVKSRTIELEQAKARAEKSSEMKSAFISTISHEMRTPLNGILGTLNLLNNEPLSPRQAHYLEMSEASCHALSALINDTLDLSKIEAGRLELESVLFDPIALLEDTVTSLALRAQEKDIKLIVDVIDIAYPSLSGDMLRLRQVVFNLLSNAIKFTDDGGVYVSAKTRKQGRYVMLDIAVRDTGIGIAPENQHKLFQAFTQADSSIAGKFGGTGLGLAICKKLCVLMGGDIQAESSVGKGSCFTATIPFEAAGAIKIDRRDNLKGKTVSLDGLVSQQEKVFFQHYIHGLQGEVCQGDADYLVVDASEWQRMDKRVSKGACLVVCNDLKEVPDGCCSAITRPVKLRELLDAFERSVTEQPAVSEVSKAEEVEPGVLERKHILVVDDNIINLEVARGVLEMAGGEVQTVQSGKDALNALSDYTQPVFDAVLMDINMPEMDGYQTTRAIRDGKCASEYTNIPVIAMTANTLASDKQKCQEAGLDEHVPKPFEPEELYNTLLKYV
tara:strand:+ start:649 stop:3570 length:2922 start_codon:yes stop_codon:yes gene_type:complete